MCDPAPGRASGLRRGAAWSIMRGMVEPLAILGTVAGLCCAVGAAVLLHRLAAAAVLDRMLAALGDPGVAAERRRSGWRMLGGALLLFAGIALLALSRWAPLAVALAALFQLGWLAVTGGALRGVLLALPAGVLVWLLDAQALWHRWIEPAPLELATLAGIATALSAVLLRHAAWRPQAVPVAPPGRMAPLRLVPADRHPPLRHADRDAPVDATALGLGSALAARLAAWDAVFQAGRDGDGPGRFPDLATEQAWYDEGCAIAGEIQRAWDGTLHNDLSRLGAMERDARRGLDAAAPTPLAQGRAMAPRCGVAEIREAFQRLDILALAADQAAPGDLAVLEHEARLLSIVLVHVAPRYRPEVDAGLAAAHPDVRAWVAGVTPAAGRPPGR